MDIGEQGVKIKMLQGKPGGPCQDIPNCKGSANPVLKHPSLKLFTKKHQCAQALSECQLMAPCWLAAVSRGMPPGFTTSHTIL